MLNFRVFVLVSCFSLSVFAADKSPKPAASKETFSIQYKTVEKNNKTQPYLEKYKWDVYESEMSYPLFSGKPKVAASTLNQFIDTRIKDGNCDNETFENFSKNSNNAGKIGEWRETFKVIRLDKNLVTLENNYKTTCAGSASPGQGVSHFIFSSSTGKEIEIKKQLVDLDKTAEAYVNKYKESGVRKPDDECHDYMNLAAMHGISFDYNIEPKKVKISPYFPESLAHCADAVEFTIEEFKELLKPESELYPLL